MKQEEPLTAYPGFILCVDDKQENLVSLKAILDEFDESVLTAHSGEEGLKYLLSYPVKLILMDVQMPEMDGFETAQLIKENEKTKEIPLIFITAMDKDMSRALEGYQTGCVDYITKPINAMHLKAKINVFLKLFSQKMELMNSIHEKEQANTLLKAYFDQVEHQNEMMMMNLSYNPTTELPNFALLQQQLTHELSKNQPPLHIAAFDFKNFGLYNSIYGHTFGDRLLVLIADRFGHILPEDCFLAHPNADEFYLFFKKSIDENQFIEQCYQIQELVSLPFYLESHMVYLSANLGIYTSAHHDNSSDILKNASTALKMAKLNSTNRYQLKLDEASQIYEKSDFISELRNGLMNHDLYLVFQPKIDVLNKKVTGAEALIRWRHPERGFISPAEFIPMAERTGLIRKVTDYVMIELQANAAFIAEKINTPLLISFNVSSNEVLSESLYHHLQELNRYKPNSIHYEIEVTESLFIDNYQESIRALSSIKELGFAISIDDFGTGYSSLSHLSSLPIDFIKIDKSFVSQSSEDQRNVFIIQLIIEMAHRLEVGLVAEGVETTAERDLLVELGCPLHQGYLYARPLPLEEFVTFLAEGFQS